MGQITGSLAMYAGLIQRKGGIAAAAAKDIAAAAARDDAGTDTKTNVDHGNGLTKPRGGDGNRVIKSSEISDQKRTLPSKRLNSDGSFGDPRLKYQPGSKVPLPWTCPQAECRRNNFQWRKSCPHCGARRPPPEEQCHEPVIVPEVSVISSQTQALAQEVEPPAKKPRPAGQPPSEVARGNPSNPNLQVTLYISINKRLCPSVRVRGIEH